MPQMTHELKVIIQKKMKWIHYPSLASLPPPSAHSALQLTDLLSLLSTEVQSVKDTSQASEEKSTRVSHGSKIHGLNYKKYKIKYKACIKMLN